MASWMIERDDFVGVLVEELPDGAQRVDQRCGAERALLVAEVGAVAPFPERAERVEDASVDAGGKVGIGGRQLLVRHERRPVVSVDQERSHPLIELGADVAVVLGPDEHDVGARHRVVGGGVHDLVVVAVTELGVTVARSRLGAGGTRRDKPRDEPDDHADRRRLGRGPGGRPQPEARHHRDPDGERCASGDRNNGQAPEGLGDLIGEGRLDVGEERAQPGGQVPRAWARPGCRCQRRVDKAVDDRPQRHNRQPGADGGRRQQVARPPQVAPVQPDNPGGCAGHEDRAGESRRRTEPTCGVPHRVELGDDRRLRTAGTVGKLGDDVELAAILERGPQLGACRGGAPGDQAGRGVDQGVALVAGQHGRPDLLPQPWVQIRTEPVVDDVEDLEGGTAVPPNTGMASGTVPAAMRSANESTSSR
jgi:hypothetical protein